MDQAQWTFAEKVVAQGLYGIAVSLSLFILGLHRGWWYMRAHFQEVVRQRDDYKALNHTTEDTAKKTLALLADLSGKLEARS
jgi:hypothetical protein